MNNGIESRFSNLPYFLKMITFPLQDLIKLLAFPG